MQGDSRTGALVELTVVICTHNRVGLLREALASLNQAARPPRWEIELLVIANACTDTTAEWLKTYAADAPHDGRLPLRWVEESTPGKSHALNTAIALIKASMVAFVDDDHRVDHGYLLGVCRAFERYPDSALFCGRILPDWDGSEPGWVHDWGPFRIYPLPVPRFDLGEEPLRVLPDKAIPGGGNLFLRRELFDRVGGFSADFGPVGHNLGGAEDIQWVKRALAAGARLQYVPDVVQYHYVSRERLAISYLVRKAYERSASTMRLSSTSTEARGVPLYLFRKTAGYLVSACFSLSVQRRRFYLVRLAAALGEIKGFMQMQRDRRAQPATAGKE